MPNQQSAISNQQSAKSRYVMIGGFLGAGKTTAVAAVAQHFAGQGMRVGLITKIGRASCRERVSIDV